MKLRRFTDAGVAKTRAFFAEVKEANNVDAGEIRRIKKEAFASEAKVWP